MLSPASARPRSFGLLKSFNFAIYGAIAIFSSFFPLYLKDIGMSNVTIGLLIAGGPVISLLANPFWGYLSDRMEDIKRILLILLIGNAAVMQLVFSLSSHYLIFAFMLVYFFFQSPLFSQSNSLNLDVADREGLKFGAFRIWGSLGWALLAVATGPIIEWLGIRRLWVVYGIMMLVSVGLALKLPRSSKRRRGDGAPAGGYGEIWRNRPFILFLLFGILISIPNSMNNTFVSIYIADMGGQNALVGWSAFLSSIFEVPVYLLMDRFLRKERRTMVLCLVLVSFLYAVRWFLMSEAVSPIQIILIQATHCLTFAGYYYVGTQLTALLVPKQFRASGQAYYALSWGGLAGIVAGVAGGVIFQNLGAQTMYRLGALTALLGAAGFAFLYRQTVKSAAKARELPAYAGGKREEA